MDICQLWMLRVLSGRGLCDELITRPEESYRLWCVVVCDLQTSWMWRPWPTGGLSRQKQTNKQYNLILTYLLTYSMVQSPSWAANWFAASQEIPRISGNPKVHYRTHKRPPRISILGQPNPIHIPTPNLLEFHPNIIHSSTRKSPQWSLSLRFPHQDHIHPPLLTHIRQMPISSHSSNIIF